MRLQNALTALVASSPFLDAGVVDAKSLPVSPIEDGSTMTTTKTTAGQARNGGIHPGASSPHRRRAAEQMRRRRDRILQRKDAVAAAAANDGDGISAEQAKRRAAKASAIIEAALAAGEKDGDAILRMVDDRVTMERDAGVTNGDRDAAVAKDGADDAGLGADESLGMRGRSGGAVPAPADGTDEAADGGLLRTDAGTGAGAAHGTAGNLSSNVKRTQSTAAVRRAVHVRSDPTSEVPPAKASSDEHGGILSSITDDISASAIVADGLHGLTDTEAAVAARALASEVETDAGMLPSVAKGKEGAALRAAGLTSASAIHGTGPASSTGSSTAGGVRRSVPPVEADGADVAAAAGPAEQHVQPPIEEDDGIYRYLEEHDEQADLGLFFDSTADDGTSASEEDGRRDLGDAAMTSSCPPSGEDPNDWVDCFEGKVRGTDTYCKDACGDDCCNGVAACDFATACIKKDGSCGEGSDFDSACYLLGYGSSYQIQISGPSCVGDYACGDMFKNNPNSGGVVSLTNSCTCDFSCHTSLFKLHCSGDSPAPLPGLPACGDPFDDVGGQSISSCAPSESPSSIPSSSPSISSAPSTRYAPSSNPTTSSPPSMSPSDMPSEEPLCPPPGEDPNDWVDCDNGFVRGTAYIPCATACGGDCCEGFSACQKATACIKKDGSCTERFACAYAGYNTSYQLQISGPSCVGSSSCYRIFQYNENGMGAVSLVKSCLCNSACYANPDAQSHCGGGRFVVNPAPLPGLPSCGNPFDNVSGFSGSTCANPPVCPPPGEDPEDWVDCSEGRVRGTTTPCATACGGQCCQGDKACDYTTACIKKDESCNGIYACAYAGYYSFYHLQISGPSCSAYSACSRMFKNNPNDGGVVSLTNSCTCEYSCYTYMEGEGSLEHCAGDAFVPSDSNPIPLPGLPSCGDPFINVGGQSSSSCAPSESPSSKPSTTPSSTPSTTPSVSLSPSKRPTKRPTPAPRPPPTRSPTKLPSSLPSGIPSATMSTMPSDTASDTPSAPPSSSPSTTASSPPSTSPSNTVSLMPSADPTISRSPSTMPSSEPSALPSSVPSDTPSLTASSQPSASPSSSPTPECQDFTNFDQDSFSFQDFGLNSVAIAFQGTLTTSDFEDATCDALKDQQEALGIDIVSCCASAELIPNRRRLQDSNTTAISNNTAVVEFTTSIAYIVNTAAVADDVWQVAFADAINSDMFGDMIGGTVVNLEQLSTKSSKSGTSGGSRKTSKSGTSGGSMKSSKSMKSGSSI